MLAELQTHPLWKVNSAVRRGFRGAAGTFVSRDEYLALLHLIRAKGFETSSMPVATDRAFSTGELKSEADVENHLLIPLLRRLGYEERDWVRQWSIAMGRGES